jgi:hypothetical protein
MNNFDKRYNALINEAGGIMGALGSAARGTIKTASAIGSGLNAAKNPGQGIATVLQSLAGKNPEERAKEPISAKNPINKEEVVTCNTTIYYQGQKLGKDGNPIPVRDKAGNFVIDPATKKPVLQQGWVSEEATVEATTLNKSDNQGNFNVKLNNPDMVFITYPYNQGGVVKNITVVGYKSKIPTTTKIIGTTTAVGSTVVGIDSSLKTWYLKLK